MDLKANITQALDKGVDPRNIVIILDIDVYQQRQFELTENALSMAFNDLRN